MTMSAPLSFGFTPLARWAMFLGESAENLVKFQSRSSARRAAVQAAKPKQLTAFQAGARKHPMRVVDYAVGSARAVAGMRIGHAQQARRWFSPQVGAFLLPATDRVL